ncbi:MAG: hypothetical protein HC771_14795 [Synechococcales cyanobacterium CRU_2_2]|nr:hypothetical protein [Synechococcales cyanobacterium CRU_2_2]
MADPRDFSNAAENIAAPPIAGNITDPAAYGNGVGRSAPGVCSVEAWVQQFRLQYPMGGLVVNLAAVHAGQYIVQATLSIGGIQLTSGLAEAKTLEEAEAIAQAIALERFGLEKLGLAIQRPEAIAPPEEGVPANANHANNDVPAITRAEPADGQVDQGDRPANDHASNGHAANGHTSNGHAANGHTSNGPNGHTSNGHATTPPRRQGWKRSTTHRARLRPWPA